MISGIYKIINKVNSKFYLGSSKDIDKRWERHLYQLRSNRHHSIHLQRAWTKYGESNFSFEVMQILPSDIDQKQLFNQEKKLLDELMPWDDSIGYNMSKTTDGGDLISYHPNREEIRQKQSKNTKNRWENLTEAEKLQYAEKMKREGNPNWKNGACLFTCPKCERTITRSDVNQISCRECRDINGENNPFYGKRHSVEYKEKSRISRLGKTNSEETIIKCKKASNDFYLSSDGQKYKEELSKKMSGSNHFLYGVGHTKESKDKMSKSTIESWANKPLEEKLNHKSVKVIYAEGNYFESCPAACKYYNKSSASIVFRCNSKNEKWKDFYFISKEFLENNKIFIIKSIKQRLEHSS